MTGGKTASDDVRDGSKPNRRAVVLLHGIGEQVPMETLRGFVDGLWTTNSAIIKEMRADGETGRKPRLRNPVWNKPDDRNHTFELHRITTETVEDPLGPGTVRTDFFEYYWAHQMQGTTLDQVLAWITKLLLRSPRRVPPPVRLAWVVAWLIVLGVIGLLVALWYFDQAPWAIGLTAAIAIAAPIARRLVPGMQKLLISYVGDVVRYVEALPPNVARRQEIRENGVALLERLMGVTPAAIAANSERIRLGQPPQWKTEYRQIILVGHSLGTIIGYDILKHAFARINVLVGLDQPKPHTAALEHYCRAGLADPAAFDTVRYQELQAAAAKELREQGSPWIVTDFVSIGSPLTHASFLLAKDEADLAQQREERVLPTCPPMMEWDRHTGMRHFTYPSPIGLRDGATPDRSAVEHDGMAHRVPHHAAHFAYTRWTNVFSRNRLVVLGDIISGPVAEAFSLTGASGHLAGALDREVPPAGSWRQRIFTHTDYWKVTDRTRRLPDSEVPDPVRILRETLWRQPPGPSS